jgi:hypothetical protein
MRYHDCVLAVFLTTLTLSAASARRGEPPPLPAPIR